MKYSKLRVPPVPKVKGTPQKMGPMADAAKVSEKAKGRLKTLMKKPAFAKGGKVQGLLLSMRRATDAGDKELAARIKRQIDLEKQKPSESPKENDETQKMLVLTFAKGGGVKFIRNRLRETIDTAKSDSTARKLEAELIRAHRAEARSPAAGKSLTPRRAKAETAWADHHDSDADEFGDTLYLRYGDRVYPEKKAKGGAIKDVMGQLEQIRQRVKTMPPGRERDALVDQYSGQRRQLDQRTVDPRRRYAGGGDVAAIAGLKRLIDKFQAQSVDPLGPQPPIDIS